MGQDRGGVYGRIAITVIAPIAALLLARIPVPGVDLSLLERVTGSDTSLFGIGSLAVRPFMSAALLVEVLALVIPRWRAWRLGGYPERDRLWARVGIVALVMVVAQAFFMVRWLRQTLAGFSMFGVMMVGAQNDPFWIAAQMLSLVGCTFLLFWLARLIDRYGAGSGFSVMIVAFLIEPVARGLVSSFHRLPGQSILAPLCLAAVTVAAITRLAGGRPLKPSAEPPGGEKLPIPASGIQPVFAGPAVLAIPVLISSFVSFDLPSALTPGTRMYRVLEGALIGAFCLLLTWLFNRPRLLAAAWKRGPREADAAPIEDRVRAAFARSLAIALAICWLVMAVDWFSADARLKVSVINLTMTACVVMDVASEVRFRHRHGALVPVWPLHRLFMLPVMLKALAAAGIPVFPRGRHYRTLWNFAAPFVPVDILVPAQHAAAAEAILRVRSGADVTEAPAAQPAGG